MLLNKTLDYVGMVLGVSGAILMSLNNEYSKFAYVLWLASSSIYTIYGYRTRQYGILILNISFLVINIFGIKQWLF